MELSKVGPALLQSRLNELGRCLQADTEQKLRIEAPEIGYWREHEGLLAIITVANTTEKPDQILTWTFEICGDWKEWIPIKPINPPVNVAFEGIPWFPRFLLRVPSREILVGALFFPAKSKPVSRAAQLRVRMLTSEILVPTSLGLCEP